MTQNKIEVNSVKPELTFSQNENNYRILEMIDEMSLDSSIQSIEDYMKKTNGFGKTEEQKDADYAQVQSIWKEYQIKLRGVKFNFHLDRSQYGVLTDILLKKLEYDVNTVFIAIELTEMLGSMSGSKYSDDKEIKSFSVDATEITYVYHLIQNYKVKGLTKEAYTFSKILRRIGEISKIVSYYDACAKRLTDDISKWALNLDAPEPITVFPDEMTTQETN
jgi:uncharacterized protein YjaG (DUF416 family)